MSSILMNQMNTYMPELLELLEESVNMDSPSESKLHGDRMSDWYADLLRRLIGGQVDRLANETYGDPLICTVGNGARRILLIGHYDTVWPEGEAVKRPFRIHEGKAYGPGVYDMKCGLLQAIFAIKALQEQGRFPEDKTLVFFINSDEEIGSPTSRQRMEEQARLSEVAFVLEPPLEPTGALKTSRKGSGRYKMVIQGVSAHAGVDPQKGISAIQELSYQIQRLHELTDYNLGTTVNVGIVQGGIGSNVVADRAEAEIDVRVQTAEEAERVEAALFALRPIMQGTRVTLTGRMTRPPMERTEQIAELYRLAHRIGTEELGLTMSEASTGGVSDGNFTAACGTPTLDGLGARGDYAHSPDEYVVLEEIPRRSALLARLIELC
ncbi:M20 family metallopeptidase [Paenibacillus sp. J2TS4]|uniref:M20 family metallopeptidase n=1 Tax=Paenibacillus sp. J2TS4 TaxID=2807194 RepID=UPI001B229DA1|nr:M20 family metallopeptidase [Paenibacillus sp. J2TS4]GIP34096.1 peptidase M20 [Paenibacillus sp. J2TS4]